MREMLLEWPPKFICAPNMQIVNISEWQNMLTLIEKTTKTFIY